MFSFKGNVASRYGINAAAVAQFIWDSIEGSNYDGKIYVKEEKRWCRCSVLMMSALMPFLTQSMAEGAIRTLYEANVITKGCFNRCKFDKTNWYTFTEYGRFLMEEDEENGKQQESKL